jgi:hypothetical protein
MLDPGLSFPHVSPIRAFEDKFSGNPFPPHPWMPDKGIRARHPVFSAISLYQK